MSKSYWLPIIALGGFLSTSALGQAPNPQGVAKEAPSIKSDGANKANGSAYPTERSPLPVIIIEKPDDEHRTKRREDDSDYRESADLDAQVRAAEAVEKQITPTYITAWLGGIGTILLIATLIITDIERRDTRRSNELQLRAYVGFRSGGIQPSKDNPTAFYFPVYMKNHGQTPAQNLRWTLPTTICLPKKSAGKFKFKEPGQMNVTLQPNQEITVGFGLEFCPAEKYIGIIDGRMEIHVWGHALYDDVFGRPHSSRYRFKTRGEDFMDLKCRITMDDNNAD